MKTKARASKAVRKATKKAPAKRPAAKKPPVKKGVQRRTRVTVARRATKKAPARKVAPARRPTKPSAVSAKKPVRGAKTPRKPAAGRKANGRVPVVREFTKREAWALFNSVAHKRTGMSGKEFIEWWNRGEFEKDPDEMQGVMSVAMLLPLVEGY